METSCKKCHYLPFTETDEKEADKLARQQEYLLSQIPMPEEETILRYPIEVWVSSGKPFVAPESKCLT